MKRLLMAVMLCASLGFADSGEDLVTVPKRYVTADGISHAVSPETSLDREYTTIARDISQAINLSLESVEEVSQKFPTVPVGGVTTVMVFWKIAGRELIHLLIGLPVYVAGMFIWVWLLKRLFFEYALTKHDKDGMKIKVTTRYEFHSDEGRICAAVMLIVGFIVWHVVLFQGIL